MSLTRRAAAIQRNRSFSATPSCSAGTSEEAAIEPDGPDFDQLLTALLEWTPLRGRQS